jgi:hypothetical protein
MILTEKYRSFLATQFRTAVVNANTVAYIWVGRTLPWVDAANVAVGDSTPPVPLNQTQNDFEYWRDMLFAKRIANTDVQFVVSRRDWVTGTIYAQYDDLDASLSSKAFFVLDATASPNKVYKCLWNNHGAQSTVAPNTIGTNVNPVATGDGYVWKYMYTITDAKFLTASWMPVESNTTISGIAAAQIGKLPTAVPFVVTDGGLGYNPALPVTVTLVGDGDSANVSTDGVQITGGRVSDIRLALGGNGYSQIASINVFQAGASVQAAARAIIPPFPNHGYDPVTELYASALMFTTVLDGTETGNLTVLNSYRRIGLLANPLLASTGLVTPTVATANTYRMTTNVTISANTGVLLPNDIVTNMTKASRPTAAVVDVVQVSSNYVVRLTSINDMGEATAFTTGDTLRNLSSGVEVTVSTVDTPLLYPFSGSILSVEQRAPVSRDAALDEEIKLIFPLK